MTIIKIILVQIIFYGPLVQLLLNWPALQLRSNTILLIFVMNPTCASREQ